MARQQQSRSAGSALSGNHGAKVDHLDRAERCPGFERLFHRREAGNDPERSVEPSAAPDRVDMRAGDD